MNVDLINGLFEFCGSIVLWRNVLQFHRDKVVRGVHWNATAFFMVWGIWNMYFFPHLDLWLSFTGGCSIVTANAVWLGQFVYYRRR